MKQIFVYIKENYHQNNVSIVKNEIGILIKQGDKESIVNFINTNSNIQIPNNLIDIFNPKETGDQFEMKVCNICHRLLSVKEFAKNQNGKNNRTVRRPSCNDCRKIIDGKDMTSKAKKEWGKVKPNYIIWECPICKKRTIPGLTSKVVLDHDHNTGGPRAWICDSCNTGLGRFKDDIPTIKNAIRYLNNSKNKKS